MKRNLSYLLCLVFSALLIFCIGAAAETITFSDVAQKHWAYKSIMSMTEKGLVKGTTEPKDGVAQFAPDKTMTRAEFITLVTRMLYPDDVKNAQSGDKWWSPYYSVALEKELLFYFDLDDGNLDKDITREEMAMVMVRAAYQQGEEVTNLVPTTRIADYDDIDWIYNEYVRVSFSLGLICGVDDKGTFMPKATLNRAAAATVAYRLIEKNTRVEVEIEDNAEVHEHFNYSVRVVMPTCIASGHTLYTCSCGYSYKDDVTPPISEHNYAEQVIAPTENEQGYTLHICSLCGAFYKDNYTEAHSHIYTNEKVVTPTCTNNGYTIYTCACGDSYKDNETAKTEHSYTDKVIAPTTSEQGYTLHTCSICGNFYKDNYVDKLPEAPKDWVNTGGVPAEGQNYQSIAGVMVEVPGKTRPILDKTASLGQITNKLNGYIFNVYDICFYDHGMGHNFTDTGKFARLVQHEDGRFGIEILGWRKSYASDAATNRALNAVMEAMYYLSGDREVAYALWSVVDSIAINGKANTNDYGFTDVSKGIITLNGVNVEIVKEKNLKFYFS